MEPSAILVVAREHLAQIEAQIQDSEQRREKATQVIAALAKLSVPIRKLPAELLSNIFLHAVTPPHWALDYIIDDAARYRLLGEAFAASWGFTCALRLSHVCRTWRKVSLETPRMWCFPLPLRKQMANTVDSATMAKHFLGRSHPFTFPLDVGDMPMDVRKEVVRAMRRVAGLSLVTTQLLEDMIGDNCPFLENLHILSIDLTWSTSASKSPKIVAFLTAAKLARVRLTGIFLPLPWSKLQELTLVTDSSIVSASTCFASIVQCVQLVTLKLTMPIWFEDEPSDPQPPQTLPLLTSLDFCVAGGDFLFPFFAGLSLPSLRTFALELGLDYGWTPETQDEITEFFSRSPHLDKLSLRRCEINDIDLQEMLVQTPMLQELKLTTCFMDAFTSSIVEQLTYNPNDAILRPLVPQLHSLEVEGFYREMEDTTLQAMIESRLAENLGVGSAVVGWRRICLIFAGDGHRERGVGELEPLGASLRVRVVQLKASGLDITIL